jgi:DNA-binding CsgD family transcriptional regulator
MLMSHETRMLRSEMLAAALDALAAGVVLAASDGQVIYMNSAAAQQIKASNVLRLFNNRFSLLDPAAARALKTALAGAGNRNPAQGGKTLVLPNGEGTGILATILPLDSASDASSLPFAGVTAIFIQDLNVEPHCLGEAFAKLYGLTKAELRVALHLWHGLTLQEVGKTLFISGETVKTHLKHIFQKTGICRQVDLLALMSRASGLIRAT